MTTGDYKKLKKLVKEFVNAVGEFTRFVGPRGPLEPQDVTLQAKEKWDRLVSSGAAKVVSDNQGPKLTECIDGITFTLPLTASVVAPVPDFKKIFLLAEHYNEASHLLDEQSRRDQSEERSWACSGPKLLVDSFAGELYLKCFSVQDTGEAPHGHEWETLFVELNPGTQRAIKLEYRRLTDDDTFIGNLPLLAVVNPGAVESATKIRDFDRALKAASKTFASKQYLYEPSSKEEWFYAYFLVNSFRNVLMRDIRLTGVVKNISD